MKKTIALHTLGCRANQFDSESISAQFESEGWVRVSSARAADVHLINTCTVTNKGASKSRQLVRKLLRANKGKIVVTGCCAQEDAISLALLGAHLVVDNVNKDSLYKLFIENPQGGVVQGDITKVRTLLPMPVTRFGNKTRAHLKIQDGCNCRCAYCIIPAVRGNSRSIPSNLVLEQARQLIDEGYRELVLTGIHLGQYSEGKSGFEYMLRRILELPGDFRIRLSAMEPKEISKSLLPLFSEYPEKLCRHLHIAIQSAASSVLKRMKRPYNSDFLFDIIDNIISIDDGFGIGLDIIAGFPGESHSEFEETKRFINEIPVFYGHVFPFSPKISTPAASFPNQLPGKVKKERCEILRRLLLNKQKQFLLSQTDKIQQALFETPKTGISGNYIRVSVAGKTPGQGALCKVRLTRNISVGNRDKFPKVKAHILP